MPGAFVVFGSGPGIGVHVASHFASQGFRQIALVARNKDQLATDSAAVKQACAGVEVWTYAVDVGDAEALSNTLDNMMHDLRPIEVVFFNAARVKTGTLLEVGNKELLYDIKISTMALHQLAQWAMPQLANLARLDSVAKPCLLVTSSHLPHAPDPKYYVLSITKAAQRNLTELLAKMYQPQGVHVGLVTVAGEVSPQNKVLNPANIARKAYELFAQDKGHWTPETYLTESG
ncbi:hypothetical protein E4U41_006692 [Claviceps citrina]|nr:hypothetical protein E4U41_006692 [Claviceps citrina]